MGLVSHGTVLPVPPELRTGPFTRARALSLGVTPQMLRGQRFVRLYDGVWRHRDHAMTAADRLEAARLALPADAHLTGVTRLQALGLDVGPRLPMRFVIARDHHVHLKDVFLHRTVRMPPLDDVGVAPVAAYVAYCARARVIDAITVGDWLLHHGRDHPRRRRFPRDGGLTGSPLQALVHRERLSSCT